MKLLSVLFILFLVIHIPVYSQNTINIPADYSTIQEGINAAVNGDLVLVADGLYYENINFRGKAITVASHFIQDWDKSHIENTIIDGSQPSNSDSGSVVTFNSGEDTTSTLCGFTITGGTGIQFGNGYRLGGGICIYGASPVIKANIIENNSVISILSSWGSAIFAQTLLVDRTCIIEDNIIRNNFSNPTTTTVQGAGAVGLWYTSSSTIILRNNNIYNNTLTGYCDLFGGGIIMGATAENDKYICICENNIIVSNVLEDTPASSTQWGGGIYIQDVNAFVRNNIIAYNSSEDGGGVYYFNNSATPSVFPVLENNTIFGNTIATNGYGGALNTNREYYIDNCIIWGNSSPQYYGASATISYSDLEETYPNGSYNISLEPEFLDTTYFLLHNASPCIDKGNPDPMYNDVEDPNNPGYALFPALGSLTNDMGAHGGSNSNWPSIISDTLNVPADYATIQEAIDAAIYGNVVLVAEGTYYENINFKGKAITVASHFIIDGDSTHIENTIIDGSQATNPDSGSVVYFVSGEDTNSVLCGFTITGGTGTNIFYNGYNIKFGGGICAINSGVKIKNNIIEFNQLDHPGDVIVEGGGIGVVSLDSINCFIESNVIRNNSVNSVSTTYVCQGGGLRTNINGNLWIVNNKICDNTVTGDYAYDGGISFNDFGTGLAYKYIANNLISGNEVNSTFEGGGGGTDIYSTSAIIKNNLIVNNSADKAGGIWIESATNKSSVIGRSGVSPSQLEFNKSRTSISEVSILENNTIVNNTAAIGGGIYVIGTAPQIINSIVWGNNAANSPQIYGTIDIQYSDIEGGYAGYENIDQDPQFVANNEYFLLNDTSPCIDAGNPDPMYFDVGAGGNPLPPAQGSLINDMGHFGGPSSLWYLWDLPTSVEEESNVLSDYNLKQNYPNPFNPSTKIEYHIPELSFVTLKVYDLLGNEILTLVNQEQPFGNYTVELDASALSSGVYFYQLKAAAFIQTKKMILLK